MPRLTDQQYLDRRKVVFREWLIHHGALFVRLPLSEQHALHTYFATELELQRAELLAHRARLTRKRPALAQEAGRAFRDLELLRAGETSDRVEQYQASLTRPISVGGKKRSLTVLPQARPGPDLRRLARVLAEISQSPDFDELVAKVQKSKKKT